MFMEASTEKKRILVKDLWSYFNLSTKYGRRGVQYTDLLGYFTIKSNLNPDLLKSFGKMVGDNLNSQLHQLATHSNAALYSRLSEQLSFGGFYLESQPCLACNSQQDSFTTSRLSAIKREKVTL
jgi:E3 ubiquitin-protein ligase UBR4